MCIITYLSMSTLVESFCKQPVDPIITGEKNGVIFTRLLFQLDSYRYQLVIAIDVEQAYWSSAVAVLTFLEFFQDLQITNVDMTSLEH